MTPPDAPTFTAPWQAQAFALAVTLNERGAFTWEEWSATLGAELARLGADAEGEDGYYRAWLAALETIAERHALVGAAERRARAEAWDRAARATPHGEPIALGRDTG